jgi:hypothetical protein
MRYDLHAPARRRHCPVLFAVAFAAFVLAGSADLPAALIITPTAASGVGAVFPVSNSDLLQTNLSGVSSTGTFASFSANTLSLLSDGAFGASGAGASGGTASVAPASLGTTIRFDLNLTLNILGYTLTQLDTFVSWDTGRDGQEYTVAYSTVAAPNTFLTLATVPQFEPPVGTPFADSHTRIRLTDSTGVLATNVASIRYTFTNFEANGTAYREIDAIGTPVPEPASLSLVGIAGLALLSRRRKAA